MFEDMTLFLKNPCNNTSYFETSPLNPDKDRSYGKRYARMVSTYLRHPSLKTMVPLAYPKYEWVEDSSQLYALGDC
jgi:hypothetical protein